MPDRTFLFDELVTEPNLRGKVYEVSNSPDGGLACVDLTARRAGDWFFARRWLPVRGGRRLLFRLLDECERHGWRFAVSTGDAGDPPLRELKAQSKPASNFVAELDDEEKELYGDLFPEETRLLSRGYDWNHERVWRHGKPFETDPYGRILERDEGVLWEWVRVDEEFTWRRYPLERIRTAATLPNVSQ
jgi:hypothetical protein